MPTPLDPRWLTTPVGGLVGLVLARKLLPEKDRTVLNQGIGTALGAGGGFVAGGMIKAHTEQADQGTPWKNGQSWMQHYVQNPRSDMPDAVERERIKQLLPTSGRFDESFSPWEKNQVTSNSQSVQSNRELMQVYRTRALASRVAKEDPKNPPELRALHAQAEKDNTRLYSELAAPGMESGISNKLWMPITRLLGLSSAPTGGAPF